MTLFFSLTFAMKCYSSVAKHKPDGIVAWGSATSALEKQTTNCKHTYTGCSTHTAEDLWEGEVRSGYIHRGLKTAFPRGLCSVCAGTLGVLTDMYCFKTKEKKRRNIPLAISYRDTFFLRLSSRQLLYQVCARVSTCLSTPVLER